jgi:hypothetical protein
LLLSIASFVLGLLHWSHRREMDAMKKDVEDAKRDAATGATNLAKHQLYAAETYPRKADVERAMERSEERIMKRLDELSQEIRDANAN